ncbi:hypothetical protein DB88DRAFT_475238 [Papiliotrema laurentii]|uniref:Uncharacterized protein n=1 Tax=Papiliotrema laurentii TaxID=5418 RepID=A0AAD9CTP8_PAPLA|nr:hypothetical protein DB88DRAFT_475238 [Papiliotrema laurentii]
MSLTQTDGETANYNPHLPLNDRAVLSAVYWYEDDPSTQRWLSQLHRSVESNGNRSMTPQSLRMLRHFEAANGLDLVSALKTQLSVALKDQKSNGTYDVHFGGGYLAHEKELDEVARMVDSRLQSLDGTPTSLSCDTVITTIKSGEGAFVKLCIAPLTTNTLCQFANLSLGHPGYECQSRASDRRPPTTYGEFRLPDAKGGEGRRCPAANPEGGIFRKQRRTTRTRSENVKEPAGKQRKLGRSRDEGADGHIRGKAAMTLSLDSRPQEALSYHTTKSSISAFAPQR